MIYKIYICGKVPNDSQPYQAAATEKMNQAKEQTVIVCLLLWRAVRVEQALFILHHKLLVVVMLVMPQFQM